MGLNALFLTYHNWRDNRIGGFHYLAEALAERGDAVSFFSFPRPLFSVLTSRSERTNARAMVRLLWGRSYRVGMGSVVNFTAPTLAMPGRVGKALGPLNSVMSRTTVPPLQPLLRRRAPKVDVCVVESTVAVCLLDDLKQCYPQALLIYRPSDPLVASPNCPEWLAQAEKRMMATADKVLLVNEEGRETYEARFGARFMEGVKSSVLENGVNLDAFRKSYPRPRELGANRVVLYVGAAVPDWSSMLALAKALPESTVCVVCPERPEKKWLRSIRECKNLLYLGGVPPSRVPAYVTNCSVFAVAYQPGLWRYKPWGFQAKLQQAIAAKKPVVGINVDPALRRYGIVVAEDQESFAESVRAALTAPQTSADLPDLGTRDWEQIKARFVAHVDGALGRRGSGGARQ
jgi:hypothetical protein